MTDDAETGRDDEQLANEPAEDLAARFDRLMAARGIIVPASRRAGAIAVYADLERQTRLLRRPRAAGSEPAGIFCLRSFLRGQE